MGTVSHLYRDYKLHRLKRDARANSNLPTQWEGLLRRGELSDELAEYLWLHLDPIEVQLLFAILTELGEKRLAVLLYISCSFSYAMPALNLSAPRTFPKGSYYFIQMATVVPT